MISYQSLLFLLIFGYIVNVSLLTSFCVHRFVNDQPTEFGVSETYDSAMGGSHSRCFQRLRTRREHSGCVQDLRVEIPRHEVVETSRYLHVSLCITQPVDWVSLWEASSTLEYCPQSILGCPLSGHLVSIPFVTSSEYLPSLCPIVSLRRSLYARIGGA